MADSLPLKPLRRLVQALELLPDAASEALEHYQPAGFLDDMLFTLPEQGSRFSLSARLREFGVRAWSGAPRAEGLYGFIQMTADSGRVTLDTPEPAVLGFPHVQHRLDTRLFIRNRRLDPGRRDHQGILR